LFSGIVEEVGVVEKLVETGDGVRLTIFAPEVVKDVAVGDSISVDGICLTVTSFDDRSFTVEAVLETLRRTKLKDKKEQQAVNLERALKLQDRLGGHLVTGHIDAVARVAAIEEEGFSRVVTFELPFSWWGYFVPKGSVAVDGVSLTVVSCVKDNSSSSSEAGFRFTVALIPHTLEVTTLGKLKPGDRVNIETDVVARYIAQWMEPYMEENLKKLTATHEKGGSKR